PCSTTSSATGRRTPRSPLGDPARRPRDQAKESGPIASRRLPSGGITPRLRGIGAGLSADFPRQLAGSAEKPMAAIVSGSDGAVPSSRITLGEGPKEIRNAQLLRDPGKLSHAAAGP